MNVIDTHCHLDDHRFNDDFDDVIKRAGSTGVDRFIVPSVCEHGWQKLLQMAENNPSIYPAFGMHPWFCDRHTPAGLKQLSSYLDRAVAVGECGLDFGQGRAPEDEQLKWFRPQLELAEERGLPVVLHVYRSLDKLLHELRSFPTIKGVLHSFSGSQQQAEQCMAQGFYLGIGGAITRQQATKLRSVVMQMPLEYLLLETDAPDQPGVNHRGQRNEPAFLIEIANEIATMRGLEVAELVAACNDNARELFSI